jgi:hypothetical protein
MKKSLCLAVSLILTISAARAEKKDGPCLRWNFENAFQDSIQKKTLNLVDSQNKAYNLEQPFVDVDRFQGKAIKLDGNSYLQTAFKGQKDQTYHVRIKFGSEPKGVIISRNRPKDAFRGIECGLVNDKFYCFNGNKPSAMVSDGKAKGIESILGQHAKGLAPGVWFDIFLRFKAGECLDLCIVDLDKKRVFF